MRLKGVGLLIFMVMVFFLVSVFSLAEGGGAGALSHQVCCVATDVYGGGGGVCAWVTSNNTCQYSYPMGPYPPCPQWVQGHNIYYATQYSAYTPIQWTEYNWANCQSGCSGVTPDLCPTIYGYNICTNTDTDWENCGSCGNVCSGTCNNGVCQTGGGGGCQILEMTITPLTCDGSNCAAGDKINFTYHYNGAYCAPYGYKILYINATKNSCAIQFGASSSDLEGIYYITQSGNVFFNGAAAIDRGSVIYTVPNVGSDCIGQTVSKWQVSGDDGYPPSGEFDNVHEFFSDVGSITFTTRCGNGIVEYGEQCDDGPTLNYGFWNPWNINTNRRCLENCQLNLCYIN